MYSKIENRNVILTSGALLLVFACSGRLKYNMIINCNFNNVCLLTRTIQIIELNQLTFFLNLLFMVHIRTKYFNICLVYEYGFSANSYFKRNLSEELFGLWQGYNAVTH